MTWWGWILFWIAFWAAAAAFLGWRTWRLWPHAQEFGRALSSAWQRLDEARVMTSSAHRADVGSGECARASRAVARPGEQVLAWERPPSYWRRRRATERGRRRELRLDDHAKVWASWRRPVD